MAKRRCIGFGEFERKCMETAAKPSLYWCHRCEALRRAHISRRFGEMDEVFSQRKAGY